MDSNFDILGFIATGIPKCILFTVGVLASLVSLLFLFGLKHKRQCIIYVWLIAYLFLMFYTTVFKREPHDDILIHLKPFWSIQSIQDGCVETFYEKTYNIIFYIPYGILIGLRKKKIKTVVLIGFITSLTIEILQLMTRTGMCEMDDVICNTFGYAVGVMIAIAICWAKRKIKNK